MCMYAVKTYKGYYFYLGTTALHKIYRKLMLIYYSDISRHSVGPG